jgi:hypothetical protein
MSNAGKCSALLVGAALLTSAAACSDIPDETEGMTTEQYLSLSLISSPTTSRS